jgi:hypothetical protein
LYTQYFGHFFCPIQKKVLPLHPIYDTTVRKSIISSQPQNHYSSTGYCGGCVGALLAHSPIEWGITALLDQFCGSIYIGAYREFLSA